MPLCLRENHLERLMTAGGAPIDCAQPFAPQKTEKSTNRTTPPATETIGCTSPKIPISKLRIADSPSPKAMKRLILQ